MSLLLAAKIVCEGCGTETPSRLAASVNADRRPDLRARIMNGSFQSEACTGCGGLLRLPLHLSYTDMGRGQWILAEGAAALAEWRDQEAEAREIFTRSYGPQAPEAAREMGQGLVPRLVFGWAALREKLLARELDLDDVALEALKIAIVREVPDAPVSGRTELRLVGSSEGALELAWLEAETEAELATLSLPREAYDAFANDTGAWQAVHAQFAAAMFVDFRRLFVG